MNQGDIMSMNGHTTLAKRTRIAAAATATALLLFGAAAAPDGASRAPGEAVLVSAAGNVIRSSSGPNIELAAVYYHGFYSTKAKCQAALKAKLATGMYNFGGCSLFNQSPHAGEWQLWLDEDDCTDRVATTIDAASVRERNGLLDAL